MTINELASAIYNDIQSGVSGINANPTMSIEQLEDEIVAMRETVIRDLWLQGKISKESMYASINCLEVDCADQNKCCESIGIAKTAKHCEIPQLLGELGTDAIAYIGATDRSKAYRVYFNRTGADMNKYKARHAKDPYVYIERTPNANNMYDCWIYNAPFVKNLAIIGVFRDPRQLEDYACCNQQEFLELGPITTEIKDRIVKNKLSLYRQYLMPPHQTDLSPR